MDWIDSGFITGAADESAAVCLIRMCACAQLMFRAKYQDLNATINPDICTFLSRMKAPLCRV